jgi:antitoxin component YwqK of YwqJK toxin-antitoxin module
MLLCAACASDPGRWARVPLPDEASAAEAPAVRTARDPETGVVVQRWLTQRNAGRIVKVGKEEHYWPDGAPRAERFHAGGLPTGRWRTWYANGNLRSDYTYADDARPMLFFHEDGAPEARGAARGGVREGPWTWWYPDGSVAQEGCYLDGAQDGCWTLRHPGGALRSRGLYRAGERVGAWRHWPASPATMESDWWPVEDGSGAAP